MLLTRQKQEEEDEIHHKIGIFLSDSFCALAIIMFTICTTSIEFSAIGKETTSMLQQLNHVRCLTHERMELFKGQNIFYNLIFP